MKNRNFEQINDIINFFENNRMDYSALLCHLQSLSNALSEYFGFEKFNVDYSSQKSILLYATVESESKEIKFNLNRIKCFTELNFNSFEKNFRNTIKKIKLNYERNTIEKNELNDAVYFSIKNRPLKYIYKMGCKSMLPYEIINTLMHELQHYVQYKQKNLFDINKENSNEVDYYKFIDFYERMQKEYKESVKWGNNLRPIEVDANIKGELFFLSCNKELTTNNDWLARCILNMICGTGKTPLGDAKTIIKNYKILVKTDKRKNKLFSNEINYFESKMDALTKNFEELFDQHQQIGILMKKILTK